MEGEEDDVGLRDVDLALDEGIWEFDSSDFDNVEDFSTVFDNEVSLSNSN